MSSWSTKRQFAYAGVLIFIFLTGFGFLGFHVLYKPASCFDGKQNGGEEDVDCGGSCAKLCSIQTIQPIILWQRISRVGAGIYNALAYVENSNPNAAARNLHYQFKLYDKDGLVVGTREGDAYLPPNKISPLFEGAIDTGERSAARVTFEFTENPNWQKELTEGPKLDVSSKKLSGEATLPRLDATITNASIEQVGQADVIAILYDEKGNAVAFARSVVLNLAKGQSQNIVFTWREPFSAPITKIEIIPRIPS